MDLKWVNDNIVDLRKSAWDLATSDPGNGIYNFTKKTIVPMRSNSDCEHQLSWSRYDATNGYRELNAHRAEGFVPVLVSQGLYFPQGAYKNPVGMWQFDDVVLIMRPMIRFLEERRDAVELSKAQVKASQRKFATETRSDGSQVEGAGFEDRRIL